MNKKITLFILSGIVMGIYTSNVLTMNTPAIRNTRQSKSIPRPPKPLAPIPGGRPAGTEKKASSTTQTLKSSPQKTALKELMESFIQTFPDTEKKSELEKLINKQKNIEIALQKEKEAKALELVQDIANIIPQKPTDVGSIDDATQVQQTALLPQSSYLPTEMRNRISELNQKLALLQQEADNLAATSLSPEIQQDIAKKIEALTTQFKTVNQFKDKQKQWTEQNIERINKSIEKAETAHAELRAAIEALKQSIKVTGTNADL